MAKAIKIDSTTRTISEVEQNGYKDIHAHVGGYIQIGFVWENGDVLFVDEEGLLKPVNGFFRFSLRADPQPLAGNGIIVGKELIDPDTADFHGNADVTITVEQVTPLVQWLTPDQAQAWARGNASEPSAGIFSVGRDGTVHHEVLARVGEVFGVGPEQEARAKHIAWAKRRALEYLDRGDAPNAAASLVSDMAKHPGCALTEQQWQPLIDMAAAAYATGDTAGIRKFIEELH